MNLASTGRLAVVLTALISTLLFAQGMAWAGMVTFVDLTSTITLSDTTGRTSGFECPVTPEVCAVTLAFPQGANGSVGVNGDLSSRPTLYYTEPGGTDVSDSLSVTEITLPGPIGGFRITFISVDGGGGACPVTGCAGAENGLVQTAMTIQYFDLTGTLVATDTIAFQSDGVRVPEPASALLLLAGVGVVAMAGRRAHRKLKAWDQAPQP
jgi:hypothetical protein